MWRSMRGPSSADFEPRSYLFNLLEATVHDASESGESGSEDL